MIQEEDPDSIRYAVKNAVFDGADCIGIQLEYLKKEYKNEGSYKKIFTAC